MCRISLFFLLLSGAVLLLTGCTRPSKSISFDEQFLQDASSGTGDTTPIALVNGKEVPRGSLTTAAALLQTEKGIPIEQAYQEAFNVIIQNSLLTDEAHRRGLDPSPEELAEQVHLYFEEMSQQPEVIVILKSQAEKLGPDWQSEEFKKEYSKGILNGILYERLRKQIEEQVKGDTGLFAAEMQKLLVTLLPDADIKILYENLPPGAGNIKIPPPEELPWIKNPYPTIQPYSIFLIIRRYVWIYYLNLSKDSLDYHF